MRQDAQRRARSIRESAMRFVADDVSRHGIGWPGKVIVPPVVPPPPPGTDDPHLTDDPPASLIALVLLISLIAGGLLGYLTGPVPGLPSGPVDITSPPSQQAPTPPPMNSITFHEDVDGVFTATNNCTDLGFTAGTYGMNISAQNGTLTVTIDSVTSTGTIAADGSFTVSNPGSGFISSTATGRITPDGNVTANWDYNVEYAGGRQCTYAVSGSFPPLGGGGASQELAPGIAAGTAA